MSNGVEVGFPRRSRRREGVMEGRSDGVGAGFPRPEGRRRKINSREAIASLLLSSVKLIEISGIISVWR
ncbi:MAG: hypothetical protein QNJ63_17580 [Calothrix sp. MO_192.B10]|nr:hypothetical protein [Calothrix sp. MO_192.B10]